MKFSFKQNFCLDNTFELLFFHTAARQEVEHNTCKRDPNGANAKKLRVFLENYFLSLICAYCGRSIRAWLKLMMIFLS